MMVDLMSGKGQYIWYIPDCEGGDYVKIRDAALAANIKHIVIKIADRYNDYNVIDGADGIDLAKGLAQVLKDAGLSVWGWQYTYGTTPEAEGAKGAQRALQVGVEGFIIDAEAEYKAAGMAAAATKYMDALYAGLGLITLPIGLASYRYPSLHQEFPWSAFRTRVDFDMPQVYWIGAHNPGYQLETSYNEFQGMTPKLPYIPTGSAFKAGTWKATPEDITQFLDKAVAMELPAANFWEWGRTKLYVPELWPAIADYPWPEEEMPEPLIVFYEAKPQGAVIRRISDGVVAGSLASGNVVIGNGEAVPDKPTQLVVRGDCYVASSQVKAIVV